MGHRSKVIAAAAVVLGLTACQTTEEAWTEWSVISEERSAVALQTQDGVNLPSIRRQARKNTTSFVKQEIWDWQTGRAFMMLLPRNRYMREEIHDTSLIISDIKFWTMLRRIELEADESIVQEDVNRLGPYHYFISDRNNAGLTCFVFRQLLPVRSPAGYRDQVHGSQGLFLAYDCQPTENIEAAKFKEQMRAYVETFTLKS